MTFEKEEINVKYSVLQISENRVRLQTALKLVSYFKQLVFHHFLTNTNNLIIRVNSLFNTKTSISYTNIISS